MVGFIAHEVLHQPISPKWEITLFYLVLVAALLVTEIKTTAGRVDHNSRIYFHRRFYLFMARSKAGASPATFH